MSFQAWAASWSAYTVATSGRIVPSSSSRAILPSTSADGAGTTMDQDRLSLFQVTVGEDSLPRSLGGHRHGCRLLKGEVGRFPCDDRRLDSQILRVGAAHSNCTEYGITWRRARNVTAN